MDFKLSYSMEQEDFRNEVRDWLEANIPEDMKAPVDRLDVTDALYIFWRDMHQQLAAKGWLYPTYPKEYGGGGLSGEQETILLEEFERARVLRGFTNPYIFPTLLVWGTEEQKTEVPETPAHCGKNSLPELLRAQRRVRPGIPSEQGGTGWRRLGHFRAKDIY